MTPEWQMLCHLVGRPDKRRVDAPKGIVRPLALYPPDGDQDMTYTRWIGMEGDPVNVLFSMELLEPLPEDGPGLNWSCFVPWALELMRAVAWCHAEGVVHADLGSHNVLVRDGLPVVVDFGLSNPTRPGVITAGNMEKGPIRGNPTYMAPELIHETYTPSRPSEVVPWVAWYDDARIDSWGVGVILFEWLLGRRRPFTHGNWVSMDWKLECVPRGHEYWLRDNAKPAAVRERWEQSGDLTQKELQGWMDLVFDGLLAADVEQRLYVKDALEKACVIGQQ